MRKICQKNTPQNLRRKEAIITTLGVCLNVAKLSVSKETVWLCWQASQTLSYLPRANARKLSMYSD